MGEWKELADESRSHWEAVAAYWNDAAAANMALMDIADISALPEALHRLLIVAVARREERLAALKREAGAGPARVSVFPADLRDPNRLNRSSRSFTGCRTASTSSSAMRDTPSAAPLPIPWTVFTILPPRWGSTILRRCG